MNILRFMIPSICEIITNPWFNDMDELMMPGRRSKTYKQAKRRARRLGFRR